MGQRSDKRVRLINAAKELFYKQGFNNTTIADIAKLADVPLGNVYYYFKTKDEICDAVIREISIEINSILSEFSALPTAEDKLFAIVDYYKNRAEEVAQHGNIFSNLVQELSRQNSPLVVKANEILIAITDFLAEQFKSLSNSEADAKQNALKFLASLEGMQVLALSFQNAAILTTQAEMLKFEIKSISATVAA